MAKLVQISQIARLQNNSSVNCRLWEHSCEVTATSKGKGSLHVNRGKGVRTKDLGSLLTQKTRHLLPYCIPSSGGGGEDRELGHD